MRPSSKQRILDAAVQVAARGGIAGVTLEAVADEAGLTKGGLLYHFPSKDALLLAVEQHLLDGLEARLLDRLGKPLEEASQSERAAAYVEVVSSQAMPRAELVFVLESLTQPGLVQLWEDLVQRWMPMPDVDALDLFVARLAVDGLWLFDATNEGALTPKMRRALIERITRLT